LLVVLSVSVFALELSPERNSQPAVRQEVVDFVNNLNGTWKAAIPIKFATATGADARRLMGSWGPNDPRYEPPSTFKTKFVYTAADIPSTFDVRANWPQCTNIIGHVRDQSACGSCWAFGSTESFNDRYCIKTGDSTTLFSPEDINDCCSGTACGGSVGCNGGQITGAWKYFGSHGVVTGGDYPDIGNGQTCKPYSLPACAHHVTPPPGAVTCDSLGTLRTPSCTSTCSEKNYVFSYSIDKHFASSEYGLNSVQAIQLDLLELGTVAVTMDVYEDFLSYSSGVYHHVTGAYDGGHAIKVIGWGTENGVNYWTCVNSWNYYWGEQGTFRIRRGTNECGIESGAAAGNV